MKQNIGILDENDDMTVLEKNEKEKYNSQQEIYFSNVRNEKVSLQSDTVGLKVDQNQRNIFLKKYKNTTFQNK